MWKGRRNLQVWEPFMYSTSPRPSALHNLGLASWPHCLPLSSSYFSSLTPRCCCKQAAGSFTAFVVCVRRASGTVRDAGDRVMYVSGTVPAGSGREAGLRQAHL